MRRNKLDTRIFDYRWADVYKVPFKSRFWSKSTKELRKLGFNLKWFWTSNPFLQKKFRNWKWVDSCVPNRSNDFLTKRHLASTRVLLLSSKLSNWLSVEYWRRSISTTVLCPHEVLPIIGFGTPCSLRLLEGFRSGP